MLFRENMPNIKKKTKPFKNIQENQKRKNQKQNKKKKSQKIKLEKQENFISSYRNQQIKDRNLKKNMKLQVLVFIIVAERDILGT